MSPEELRRLLPERPTEADPVAERLATSAPLFEALVGGYAAVRLDWSRARAAHGRVQRKLRSLGSGERRFVLDTLAFLVRHERTLGLLVDRAGLSSSASRAAVERARCQAALLLHGGLRADALLGTSLDWDAVLDPVHTLTGWLRLEGPSAAEALGTVASLPNFLARRLLELPDPIGLAAALNRRAPLCLRVNRPSGDRALLLEELPGARPTELAADGLVLAGRQDVFGLPQVQSGLLEVQDEGSQLIAELCAPEPGWQVMDVCAGALGKSIALASLMQGRGAVLASDLRQDALQRGMRRARRCGYSCIRALPAKQLPRPAGRFDLVLVDAPCTGSGALRRRPWSRWTLASRQLQELPALQDELLRRSAPQVRPGGRLVYATCSIFEEENQAVVDRFLAAHPEWRLSPASETLGSERAELIGDGRVLMLYPHLHGTDGFFAAVLTRT